MSQALTPAARPDPAEKQQLIFLVHHRIASRDGQAVHLEELVSALIAAGHSVTLVGPGGFRKTSFGNSSRLIQGLKEFIPRYIYQLMEIAYNSIALVRLILEIRRIRPNVIYERFSLYLLAGVIASRLFQIPLMLEINSPLFEERNAAGDIGFKWLGRLCQGWIWRQANCLLPVTGVLAATVRSYGVSKVQCVHVIPNGVDPAHVRCIASDASKTRDALGLQGRLIIGFAGFLREWNCVNRVLEFIERYGTDLNLQLLIVGDGPARSSLEEFARARNLSSRLTITGLVPRQRISALISTFDVAVLPGVTEYSSPLKMFEYMQLRRAILAPDSQNIKEILVDQRNALLFRPDGTPPSFGECLLRLCKDEHLRRSLGEAAEATIVTDRLTWSSNAQRVANLASSLSRMPSKGTQPV